MNVDQWQKTTIKERKRLLVAAGYNANNYAYRAFNSIPRGIQDDINFVIRREQARTEAGAIYA
jgi:P2-related tail formation protein